MLPCECCKLVMFWTGEGGGCFKNGFNSKSDKRCHLDPSDPSEISLLKRKKEKKGRGRGEERKKGKERRKKGSAFILFQMWDLMGKYRGRRKEGKRQRHWRIGLSNPERPVVHSFHEGLHERSSTRVVALPWENKPFQQGCKSTEKLYLSSKINAVHLLNVKHTWENKESFPHLTLMLNFGIN